MGCGGSKNPVEPLISAGGGGMSGVPETASVVLLPCSLCGRKFKEEALVKHEAICAKSSSPRKKFEVQRVDAEANEAANSPAGVKREANWKDQSSGLRQAQKVDGNWKQESNALREQMKVARSLAQPRKHANANMRARTHAHARTHAD